MGDERDTSPPRVGAVLTLRQDIQRKGKKHLKKTEEGTTVNAFET